MQFNDQQVVGTNVHICYMYTYTFLRSQIFYQKGWKLEIGKF